MLCLMLVCDSTVQGLDYGITHVECYMRSQHHSVTVQLWCVFGNMPGMTGSFFFPSNEAIKSTMY